MKTNLSKAKRLDRNKVIHISDALHKKLKMFCVNLDLNVGDTAEKAISDYIKK